MKIIFHRRGSTDNVLPFTTSLHLPRNNQYGIVKYTIPSKNSTAYVTAQTNLQKIPSTKFLHQFHTLAATILYTQQFYNFSYYPCLPAGCTFLCAKFRCKISYHGVFFSFCLVKIAGESEEELFVGKKKKLFCNL